ncbi:MAG: PilZ domain-containing protein [Cellvibrionaceae bacterium]
MTNKDGPNRPKSDQHLSRSQTSSSQGDERRVFNRVGFTTSAEITQGRDVGIVKIIDISLKGVLIKHVIDQNAQPFHIDMQSPLQLMIPLSENTHIEMEIEAVHKSQVIGSSFAPTQLESTNDQIIGCRCTGIDPASLTHLRRLIELNSSSIDAAEKTSNRELAALFNDQLQSL